MKVFLKKVSNKIFKPSLKNSNKKKHPEKISEKKFFLIFRDGTFQPQVQKNFLYLPKKSSFHILDGTF